MRITLYIVASLILMGILGGLAYSISTDEYTKQFFGITLNLPIYIWVSIPMVIIFITSLLHMIYYGTKLYFKAKRWNKDVETLKDALYWSILKQPTKHKYIKDDMKNSASILDMCSIETNGSAEGLDNRFVRALEIVKGINSGNYIEIKDKNIKKRLSSNNPLIIQNSINRLNSDDEFAEEVLRSKESFDKSVVDSALERFFTNANLENILKYITLLDMDNFYKILDRVDNGEKLGFNEEAIDKFVNALDFECEDYMRLSITTMKKLKPQVNIALFNKYRQNDTKAENAYICMLFDYERVEDVKEFLEEQKDNEFMKYRVLIELRDNNHRFKLEDFIDKKSVCN
ncbi:Probable membrane protein Cj0124c [hydrothermal vent metagenome]|uniref:Probable membrane protein Cj0124c n=1 Tax=hydrothermal vent metagenome TaxID=652676 RepID=A0A1W1ELE2_9ZZZZ